MQKKNVATVPAEATPGGLSRMLLKHEGCAAVTPSSAEYSILAWTGGWNGLYCEVTMLLHRAWKGNVLGLSVKRTCMAACGTMHMLLKHYGYTLPE